MRVGVVNRFPEGAYALGDALVANGAELTLIPLTDCSVGSDGVVTGVDVAGVDVFLWRLSENITAATRPLGRALEAVAPMSNPVSVQALCSDKWETYRALTAAGVPALETVWVAPGARVPVLGDRTVVKPSGGAGGRDVRIAGIDDVVIPTTRESWIAQAWVGPDNRHVRVLVIAGEIVGSYRRISKDGAIVNNIEAGGIRIPYRDAMAEELALNAALAVGADIVGVDLVPDPWRVLELNSNPGIPPEMIIPAAKALMSALQSRASR
jgi:glutathione synthase/RimK-type ligase-like ATP-grasp enzyme